MSSYRYCVIPGCEKMFRRLNGGYVQHGGHEIMSSLSSERLFPYSIALDSSAILVVRGRLTIYLFKFILNEIYSLSGYIAIMP